MASPTDDITQSGLSDAIRQMLLRVFAVGTMTFFIAVCSQIAIPTGPLRIPLTLQTLGIVLAALTLGPRLGLLSVLLYIAVGAMGVGVFAEGEGGWLTIVGRTGGYILGFLVCQPFVGWIVRRRDGRVRGFGALILAGLVAHAIIFAIGVPWLYWVNRLDPDADPMSFWYATYGGCVIFLPGMLIKVALAAVIGVRLVPTCAEKIW
ncbi:MAG: biotin transporter BioY [Phycisphaerales bacterium]|nr:biotin transporter BioY [Phycisphaerales bacterium]